MTASLEHDIGGFDAQLDVLVGQHAAGYALHGDIPAIASTINDVVANFDVLPIESHFGIIHKGCRAFLHNQPDFALINILGFIAIGANNAATGFLGPDIGGDKNMVVINFN